MNNYASIGVDALVALNFHKTRESKFYLFGSRLINRVREFKVCIFVDSCISAYVNYYCGLIYLKFVIIIKDFLNVILMFLYFVL